MSSVQAGGNIVRSVDLWTQFRDKRSGYVSESGHRVFIIKGTGTINFVTDILD